MKRLEYWAREALQGWYARPWATRLEEDAYAQGVAMGIRLAKTGLEGKLSAVAAKRDPELAASVVSLLRGYGEEEIEQDQEPDSPFTICNRGFW